MGLEELLEASRQQCAELTDSLEIQRQGRAAEARVSRLKDEFLSTLSHELRTPLSAILGWTQILCGPDVSTDDLKEGLATIERNVRAQTQLIDDLHDVARMISGRIRLDLHRVELPAVIRAAIASVRRSADAKQLELTTALAAVPPVWGDSLRLQQIVRNLLNNAIKFTPPPGKIRVSLQQVASHLELSIQDSGQGISPDILPLLFERFRQGDAPISRRSGGLGVGLSLARHLAELHSGSIRAQSAGENQGSLFIVSLPIVAVGDDYPRAPSSPQNRSAPLPALPTLNGATILVVDDEPDARDMLRRVLERSHANVLVAAGGREAIELLQHKRPNIIVSDIGMPELDGYDMMRLIRALPQSAGGHTPAIALTAFARPEDRTRALGAGFQQHIKKPVETPELITSIANLLHHE